MMLFPDNDTSGDRLIRSEKIAISMKKLLLVDFLYVMANGAIPNSRLQDYKRNIMDNQRII